MVGNDPLNLVLYVDDLFIKGEERLIQHCKMDLSLQFDMTNMRRMHNFLGLEVWQEDGHIFLGQDRYAGGILRIFYMQYCTPMAILMITNWKKLHASYFELVKHIIYRQFIGSLMYLVKTRPYICFAVNTLIQFMMKPRRVHQVVAKHVLQYLQGILDYGLDYIQGMESS